MSRKGEARTFFRTFLTADQMVSDQSNRGSLREPATGTLTTIFPLPSLMRATMRPRGRPRRFLASSSGRLDLVTRSFSTSTSFIATT